MVVPYTVAWLSLSTNRRVDLHKIWKQQELSENLSSLVLKALKKVDDFMRETAPGGLIGEWAKKEDCWKRLKETDLEINLSATQQDLCTEEELKERYESDAVIGEEERLVMMKKIEEITAEGWLQMDQRGKVTGRIDTLQSSFIWKIVRKLEKEQPFSDKELLRATEILSLFTGSSF